MKTINLPEGNAFGVDDDDSGTPYANYAEQRAKTLFFVWVSLTEHKWVILRERRGLRKRNRPETSHSLSVAASALARLELIENQIEILEKSIGEALHGYHDAVLRLAEVPGFGVDSAEQVIAEVGPTAAVFPSAGQLSSWVGTCPGREESAKVSKTNRSPKGNRMMRRVLNQVANAAVKSKGSVFQIVYRRLVTRLGHNNKAIWAIAHRLCRLTWKILHQGVRYIEHGNRPNPKAVKTRMNKLIRELRSLGYQVQVAPLGTPTTPDRNSRWWVSTAPQAISAPRFSWPISS